MASVLAATADWDAGRGGQAGQGLTLRAGVLGRLLGRAHRLLRALAH